MFNAIIPYISCVWGVHLQGIQGRSRSRLLQALDNETNVRLGHTHYGENFWEVNYKLFGKNSHLTTKNKIVINKLFL